MLFIRRDCHASLVAHARQCAPEECCGVLGGTGKTVTVAFRLANIAAEPRFTYEFDPGQQLRVLKRFAAGPEVFLGVYHSHPATPAYPSATDIRRTYLTEPAETNYPGAFWVIISLASREPVIRVFTIERATVAEETWELV